MQPTAILLALAATAYAGSVKVVNNCPGTSYLTITRANQASQQISLGANGGNYAEGISGQGNSFGVTRGPDYYSPNTPKLIFGFSDSSGTLYYSLNNVDGDPFAGSKFLLASSEAGSGTVSSADARTRVGSSGADYTLTLC